MFVKGMLPAASGSRQCHPPVLQPDFVLGMAEHDKPGQVHTLSQSHNLQDMSSLADTNKLREGCTAMLLPGSNT